MPKQLVESTTLVEATTASDSKSGRMTIQVITPGWGSSGYYSQAVCEAAAPLVKTGTQMFLDHPSATENADRPERSVRDIAAVITEAGRWDAKLGAVVAECKVVGPFREPLTDLAEHIGLSIRGSATDITIGEAEGRTGPIVEGLADIASVDFVTRAGRGGKVLQVLESARFVSEATADDRARQLSDVVRAAHSADGVYAWVTDMDAERQVVWYQLSTNGPGPSRTWEQTYDVGDNDVDITLTGDPIEVSRVTKYVPVTRPDSTNPTTTETAEVIMGKIQIEEAEHTGLVEKAGRVDSLVSENATLKQKVTTFEEADAERGRLERAGVLLAESAKTAGVTFTKLEERGLLASLPVKDGALDEETFTKSVDEAAAEVLEAAKNTTGGLRGFGASTSDTAVDESAPTATPWGRPLAENKKGA
jgi:hypothetical protein